MLFLSLSNYIKLNLKYIVFSLKQAETVYSENRSTSNKLVFYTRTSDKVIALDPK